MKKIKIAVIGAGARGRFAYGKYILNNNEDVEVVAIAEPNKIRREQFKEEHKIDEDKVFTTWEDLLKKERLADGIIIANNDESHFKPSKIALEKGYHILLEKPMSNKLEDVLKLLELSKKYNNQIFMVCHVLRYTPFFEKLKKIVESKELGRLINIEHSENIGYWHFAHSFTRGNWRNSNETSPLILAKSCHDMDILLYLTNSSCKKIASFGHLSHFRDTYFDEKTMSDRCLNCTLVEECPYSAKKLYLEKKPIFKSVVHPNPTYENLRWAIENGPYGRCVYKCDNNVVDHMVTILEFENEVTATFNLSAFTKDVHRTIKLMFTHGEVIGNDIKNLIEVRKFGEEIRTINIEVQQGGHLGGDFGIMNDFINSIKKENYDTKTSALKSIESHLMAFGAEHSRLNNKVVVLEEYYKQ